MGLLRGVSKTERAKMKISKMQKKGDVKGLLKILRTQKDVQIETIKALGKIGDERAIPSLAGQCQWYETPSLIRPPFLPHRALDNILARTDKEKTLPVLIDYLENDIKRKRIGNHDTYVIKLLGKMGDPRAIGTLVSILNMWQFAEILARTRTARKIAAEALGNIGDERAIVHLEKALESKDIKKLSWNKTVDGQQIIENDEYTFVHGKVQEAIRKIQRNVRENEQTNHA